MQRHRLVVSIFVRVFECLYRVKSLIPTALAGKLKQSVVVAVYPSVRLSVRLFPHYLLNRLTFQLECLFMCGS